MTKNQICGNCGFRKEAHPLENIFVRQEGRKTITATCKKFKPYINLAWKGNPYGLKPKNHSPQADVKVNSRSHDTEDTPSLYTSKDGTFNLSEEKEKAWNDFYRLKSLSMDDFRKRLDELDKEFIRRFLTAVRDKEPQVVNGQEVMMLSFWDIKEIIEKLAGDASSK